MTSATTINSYSLINTFFNHLCSRKMILLSIFIRQNCLQMIFLMDEQKNRWSRDSTEPICLVIGGSKVQAPIEMSLGKTLEIHMPLSLRCWSHLEWALRAINIRIIVTDTEAISTRQQGPSDWPLLRTQNVQSYSFNAHTWLRRGLIDFSKTKCVWNVSLFVLLKWILMQLNPNQQESTVQSYFY